MLFDGGLILSVMIGGWLALDIAMAQDWRRRSISIGLLGGFGALWAAAELLLRSAAEPADFALGRRLLYLGVSGATVCWYWVAVEADRPRWFQQGRWRVGFAALPLLLLHSLLYWAPDGLMISLYSPEPHHGPLWKVAAGSSWILIAAGLVHYARAALRLQRTSLPRTCALALGILIPFGFNMLYAMGQLSFDPAPAMLGPAALMIRFAVVDTGLAQHLPLARSDILEQLAVGVAVIDIRDRVVDANASARELFGVADPRERSLCELLEGLDAGIEVRRFSLHSHRAWTGSAVTLTDRRDAIEVERRLELAARLEALGSLTAGIAHEVNNPLAYIQSNLNAVEKLTGILSQPEIQATLPASLADCVRDGAESVADAKDGIERISLLVARLKGFARDSRDGSANDRIDLAESAHRAAAVAGIGLADDAIEIRSRGSRIAIGQEHVVVQILVNLILNAIQASDGSPHIEIEIRDAESEVEIGVADRGRGLAPDSLDQVFDPFFTTKATGSGLGLSISFDLARRLGGRIEAGNREGGGAEFRLYLPRAGAGAAAGNAAPAAGAARTA
jgi:signal transduction histidine kinase